MHLAGARRARARGAAHAALAQPARRRSRERVPQRGKSGPRHGSRHAAIPGPGWDEGLGCGDGGARGWGWGGGRGGAAEGSRPVALWCTVHPHCAGAATTSEQAVRCLLTAGWGAVRRAQALARRADNPSDRAPSCTAHPGAYVAALAAQLDAEQAREASRAGGSPLPARTATPPPPELATPVADSLRAWSRASEALLRREARTHAATPVQPSTALLHLAMHPRPVRPRTTSAHARAPHTSFSAPLDQSWTHPAPTLPPPCPHSAPALHLGVLLSAGVAARGRAE